MTSSVVDLETSAPAEVEKAARLSLPSAGCRPWRGASRQFPLPDWLASGARIAGAWLLGSALLLYPMVYYVVQFEPRYRDPIFWVTLLLAGYALAAVLPISWRRQLEMIAG